MWPPKPICSFIDDGVALIYRQRNKEHVATLRVFNAGYPLPQEDSLDSLFAQVTGLQGRGWKEAIILRPYIYFTDTMVQALQHSLPTLLLPDEFPVALSPVPSVVFRVFDSSDTPQDAVMPPSHAVERYICETTYRELLHVNSSNFRKCVQKLADFLTPHPSLPLDHSLIEVCYIQMLSFLASWRASIGQTQQWEEEIRICQGRGACSDQSFRTLTRAAAHFLFLLFCFSHIVLKTVVGEMLSLPQAAACKMFYFMVLAELLRVKESTAPVLVLAMENIFQNIYHMDLAALDLYVEWLVH